MRHLVRAGRSICCVVTLLVHAGCASQKPAASSGWVDMSGGDAMTSAQIREAKEAAKAGSISAGERLYRFYTFAGDEANVQRSNVWLKWLAERGVPYAEFNFGKGLIDDGKDPQEGLAWMMKAKRHGYSAGDKLLQQYQREYGAIGGQGNAMGQ